MLGLGHDVAPAARQARQYGCGTLVVCRQCEGAGEGGQRGGLLVGERRAEGGQPVAVEEGRVGVASLEPRMLEDSHEQCPVGADAVNGGVAERRSQAAGGLGAGGGPGDELGQHRVVVGTDDRGVLNAAVEADARAAGDVEAGRQLEFGGHTRHGNTMQRAALGLVLLGRILRVQSHLNRMPGGRRRVVIEGAAVGHVPMPVATLAPTAKSLPRAASADSSRNGESSSNNNSIRSRTGSLPQLRCRSTYLGPPPPRRGGLLCVEVGPVGIGVDDQE